MGPRRRALRLPPQVRLRQGTDEGRLLDRGRHNLTLLEFGTLYVAQLAGTGTGEIDDSGRLPTDGAFNGTGRWIRLVSGDTSYVDGMTAAEVPVFTRLAADMGATRMDRPEDVEPNPHHGRIYAAPTNNTRRGVKRFLTVPVGAETCGPFITTDNRSVFVAVQHPGETWSGAH